MRRNRRSPRTLACALALFLAPPPPLPAEDAGGGAIAGGVPVPQPDCKSRCDDVLNRILAPCVLADGTLDARCVEDAKSQANFDYDACVQECEDQGGGFDPAVQACQGECYDAYARGLEECTAPDGSADPECVAAKDIAFVGCFLACGDVPWLPELAACAPDCTRAYEEAIEGCRTDDGGIDPACFREKRREYNDCLGACGLWLLPLEDVCVRRCEMDLQTALGQCGAVVRPDGTVDPGDEECAAGAQRAFEACLAACGINIPDEIRCAEACDGALKVQLAACNGGADCEQAALRGYNACLEGCGLAVPPIPEPDPCVGGCEVLYQDGVGPCYDPATGVVDAECLRRTEAAYLACLEGCGVVLPEPPPDANSGCTSSCETDYQQSLEKCFTVEANGIAHADGECVAAADAAYLRCLEACGVQPGPFPGDPGFPIGQCDQGCGAEILGALFDCAAENGGVVDLECLVRVGEAFNRCLAGCREQAGERALGALARTANRSFLRGDADLSGTLDITDSIRVLSYLFLGSAPLVCEDAADANDDGALDIADASAVLGRLFLGWAPLPAPSVSPGVDPTPDGLGCDGR